jgi:hypothetical protein
MPPSEPRASLTPPEPPPVLRADGLHPLQEAPDPRELTDDERASSWLHTGMGFEVG